MRPTELVAASDLAVASFDLGPVTVTVTVDAGPRILGYARRGRPQLFADVGDAAIIHPAIGRYRFLGGHRLWRAPEDPAVTYTPDDHGVVVEMAGSGLSLVGPADGDGVTKRIVIAQEGEATVVDHVLSNEGPTPVVTAAWAITQLATGGTAFLPQAAEAVDPDGLLPNRSLVLWPYSDLSAAGVTFGPGAIQIEASDSAPRFKVGWPNHRGWLGYAIGDELFVKWAGRHDDRLRFVDLGASAQCYRDVRFLELETLGPLVTLEPGATIAHREVWRLIDLEGRQIAEVAASLPDEPPEMAS